MPPPLNYLRMRNIFDPNAMNSPSLGINPVDFAGGFQQRDPYQNIFPQGPITPDYTQINPQVTQEMEPPAYQYTPKHAAADRFAQALNDYPQQEHHGKLARIGAALLGAGTTLASNDDITKGITVGQGALEYKRNKKLADWKSQITPIQQAADNERQDNAGERQFAYQTNTNQMNIRKQAETERKNLEAEKARQQRIDIAKYKADHPNAQIDTSGEYVRVFDNASQQWKQTSWKTIHMSDADKMDAQQKNAKELVQEKEKAAEQLEEVKQPNRMAVAELNRTQIRNETDPTTGQTGTFFFNPRTHGATPATVNDRPAGISSTGIPSTKEDTGQNARVKKYNAAEELKNLRPDLAPFINLNPAQKAVTIDAPGPTSAWGKAPPTPTQKAEIDAYIYKRSGEVQSSGSTGGRGGTPNGTPNGPRYTNESPPPSPKPGYRYVRKPGGGWQAVRIG